MVVLVGSAIALLLPKSWSDQLFHVSQVIVPMQDAASGTLQSIRDKLPQESESVSRNDYDALSRQQAAMEHRTAALALRAVDLEQQVEALTATRTHNVDGGRIGARGRLIPARVLADDLLSWRQSLLVTAGSVSGAKSGAAVMSNHFSIDTSDVEGLQPGLAIVLGEVYIGVVDQISSYTSRIRLLSDPATKMKVRIGRMNDDGFRVVERYFWMVGRGNNRMDIRDVEEREVKEGTVQVGDWVLSDPLDPSLPTSMTIGKVVVIEKDRKNPLFSVLTVESAIPQGEIGRVYIYDPEEAGGA